MLKKLNRKIVRTIMKFLPKSIRHEMARKLVKLPQSSPAGLTIRPAQSGEEIERALELVYQNYLKMGYTKETANSIRLTPHHLSPSTTVIVAVMNEKIVGTLSILSEYPLGLPLEKAFSLNHLRTNGERLCEIGALAIDPNFRQENGALMHLLARYSMLYARENLKIDIMTITVNPAMADLYEAIYLFEPLASKNKKGKYDYANGKPAIGLFLNLHTLSARANRVYNHRLPDENNLFKFGEDHGSWEYPPKNRSILLPRSVLTPSTIAHLGAIRTKLISNLSESESKALARSYGQNSMTAYLANGPSHLARYLANTTAIISSKKNTHFAKVYNVSTNGLLARAKGNSYSIGEVIKVAINTGANSITNLEAEIRWIKNQEFLGLQILKCSNQWNSLFSNSETPVSRVQKVSSAG